MAIDQHKVHINMLLNPKKTWAQAMIWTSYRSPVAVYPHVHMSTIEGILHIHDPAYKHSESPQTVTLDIFIPVSEIRSIDFVTPNKIVQFDA